MAVTATAVSEVLSEGTALCGQGVELTTGWLIAKPEALCAIGAYVQREYGDFGYAIEALRSITGAVLLAQVRHSDGSRFIIGADKWGNVRLLDNASVDSLAAGITDLHNTAVTP